MARKPANIAKETAPQSCSALLSGMKERIRSAQVRAAVAANQELVILY